MEKKDIWLVTFSDGSEFAVFSEEEVVEAFGTNTGNYSVQKGTWTPTTEK